MVVQCQDMIRWIAIGLLGLGAVHGWWLGDAANDPVMCDGIVYTKDGPYQSNSLPMPECFTTRFHLVTSPTTTIVITKNSISQSFDPSKKTAFLVPGFRDDFDGPKWVSMIDALRLKDYNVIKVNWTDGSMRSVYTGYDNAAANARVAGQALYEMFDALIDKGLDRLNGHCIGHSLGAHVCGYGGQIKKFGRISGMDPAGPELESLPAGGRLSKEDADFVDIIHTDGGGDYLTDYGSLVPMGHLDFYANGGKKQPGCFNRRRRSADAHRDLKDLDEMELLSRLERILNRQVGDETEDILAEESHHKARINGLVRNGRGDVFGCSHGRVLDYYTETIELGGCQADTVYSSASTTTLTPCTSGCTSIRPFPGFHADSYKGHTGLFGFTTRSSPPYCPEN